MKNGNIKTQIAKVLAIAVCVGIGQTIAYANEETCAESDASIFGFREQAVINGVPEAMAYIQANFAGNDPAVTPALNAAFQTLEDQEKIGPSASDLDKAKALLRYSQEILARQSR